MTSQLLGQFTQRRAVVILTRTHVPCGRGIPPLGKKILHLRTLVQKHLASRIHHEQMHCPVPPAARVDIASRRLPGHAILLIHHIEKFIKILTHEIPCFDRTTQGKHGWTRSGRGNLFRAATLFGQSNAPSNFYSLREKQN